MAAPATLAGWLDFIERQHPQPIALGLERVAQTLQRMGSALSCPVITVGGTNGKGSTAAILESILRAAGYRTGLYTSPHLLRYNERVRIDGREADDRMLCEGFAAVERARAGTLLTYFEFGTLAALGLFARAGLDAVILEVGLGGRLDAVNVIDADCAVLTSIGIDHVEFLGSTRERIGGEKAGIFRAGKPAVIADPDPPDAVLQHARACGVRALSLDRDFGYVAAPGQWSYWGPIGERHGLAYPALRGAIQLRNASAALCALDAVGERLPIAMQDVRRGLAAVTLPARFQVLPGRPRIILDVAHNPEAARTLAENLAASGGGGGTLAVFGMLRDKDIQGVVREMGASVSRWHLATLAGERGARAQALAAALAEARVDTPFEEHDTVWRAFVAARRRAKEDDRIVVFGSFLTVSDVMANLESHRGDESTYG